MTLPAPSGVSTFLVPMSGVAAADLVSKAAAEAYLSQTVVLLPVLNLRLHHNQGVSFGLLQAQDATQGWVLVALTAAAIFALSWFGMRDTHSLGKFGFALLAGGGLGNVIDRALDHRVTDFLDAHYAGWHWPTFNLADVAIVLGAATIVWSACSRPAETKPS